MMMNLFLITAVVVVLCIRVDGEIIRFGTPVFFGSGCQSETMQVEASEQEEIHITVTFKEYYAKTSSQRRRDRKSCNFALPIEIKSGYSLGVVIFNYKGFAKVADVPGSSATFKAEQFLTEDQGAVLTTVYEHGYDDDISIPISHQDSIDWTPCGTKSTIFRINSALTASKANDSDSDSEIQIIETQGGGFHYHFVPRSCDTN